MSLNTKKRTKCIALLLVLSLFVTFALPDSTVFASNANPGEGMPKQDTSKRPQSSKSFPQNGSSKRTEIVSKRDAKQREYLNSDGTHTVEVYAQPVHWKNKQGKWTDINNKLIVSNDNPLFGYKNASNDVEVRFAKSSSKSSLNRLQYKDMFVDFIPQNANTASGVPDGEKMKYENIYPSVDMAYSVLSNGVKEDIILKDSSAQSSFVFEVISQGLTPKLNENGTISFLDKRNKEIFQAAKPFAYDSNENYTDNIISNLSQKEGRWFLEVTLDSTWLKDQARAYPVILDPTVTFSPQDANIQDTIAVSGFPNASYQSQTYLAAGTNANGINRSYIWFNLPKINSGASITSASLDLHQMATSTSTTTIDVHRITSSWKASTLNWNNKPSYDTSVLSNKTSTTLGYWNFDVTSTVIDWYDAKAANYGFMLKARDEASDRRGFYSSEYSTNNPKLVVNYIVDPTGVEAYWSYSGNVGVHNGNLLLSDVDVTLPGKGVPIQVSRSYNSRAGSGNSTYGYGWQYNVGMSLKFLDPYNSKVILYTDGDGTKHVFTETDGQDGVWDAPSGSDLTLNYQSGTPAYYVMTDKSQTKYNFDVNSGRLEAIIDSNSNVTDLAYNADGTLKTMSDASGRSIQFNYSNGKLSSISGAQIPTVKYGYNATGDLTTVTKETSAGTRLSQVVYGYDNLHNVTSFTDPKGNTTTVQYYTTDRVDKIIQQVTDDQTVLSYTADYEYSSNIDAFTATVVDPSGISTRYETNGNGNVIKIIEDFGTGKQNITTSLTWDEDLRLTEEIDPRLKKTIFSYGENGNLEKINNAKNFSQKMQYDGQNNMTQVTGFGGETEKNHFDANNNMTAAVNPLAGTSVNEYNIAGDVTSTTAPISANNNIVVNNGFERWATLPIDWSNIGAGSIFKSSSYANGDYSIGMTSTGASDIAKVASRKLPVNGSTKYNVSWFMRVDHTTNAEVKVEWYNGSTLLSTTASLAKGTGTAGWLRKGARVDSPAGANFARILLISEGGTTQFDNVQMEEGTYVNEMNMAMNASFETDLDADGIPDIWDVRSSVNSSSDGIDTSTAFKGNKSVILNGASTSNKYFGQYLDVSGEEGTTLSFSGRSAASGVSSSGGDYMILLHVNYVSSTAGSQGNGEDWFGAPFSKSDHGWEFAERTISIPADFEDIGVYVKYMNQSGQAWFDDVKVRTVGISNALVSSYNIAENGSFEYDLDATLNPDGWEKVLGAGKTATMGYSSSIEEAYVGTHAVSVKDSSGLAVYASVQKEPIRAGFTYTASAMIKTSDVSSGGGMLKFVIYDASGNALTEKASKTISGTKDWTRVVLQLSESEAKELNANAAKLQLAVGTNAATTGTVYIDGVRLQTGAIASQMAYDASGNYLTSETDPLGNTTTYQNDVRGNVTNIQYPKAGSYEVFGYDNLDRLTYEESSSNLGIVYKYDANNNITQVDTQDNGTGQVVGSILKSYDELDRLTKFTDQNGKATTYKYDPNGNLKEILYPNAKAALFQYDALNRLQTTSYTGDSTSFSYGYDNNSNITKVTKNGTDVTDITMDKDLNQVQKVTFPAVNGIRNTVSYTYEPGGFLTSITNSPTGSTSYEYDQAGQFVKVTGSNGQSASYMIDEAGQLKKAYTFDGSQTYYTYYEHNEVGLPVRVRQEQVNGAAILDDTFVYDANSNGTEIRHMDGTKDVYVYDLADRLIREQKVSSGGTVTSDISYTYDVMGNRKTKTVNSVTITYSYDAANQLTSIDGMSLTYDGNGNTTSNGNGSFTYNAENQITSVLNTSGTTIALYDYDHEGLRTKKVSSGVTQHYYYNVDHLAYITDQNNKLRYSFTRDATGKLLTMTDHTGTAAVNYYYVLNAHGDVLGLRDKNGTMVASYSYDAFGNPITITGSAVTGDGKSLKNENPFRYASYVFDEETYMYYLNARYYDPSIGRFMTRDDIGGVNQYVYAENNPVIYTDPDGHLVWFIVIGAYYAYSAYDTYMSIKKDPSASNIAIQIMGSVIPGGKVLKMSYKSLQALMKLLKSNKVKLIVKGCNCFVAGTKVQTDEGEKNIEDIEVGDKVLAKDEINPDGELAYKEVTALYRNQRDDIIKLHVGEQIIETTDNHPFWVEGKGWVFADELQVGDKLQKADGSNLTIEKVEFVKLVEPVTVYNFTVADYHTYYVTDLGIWVHNTECDLSKWNKGSFDDVGGSAEYHFKKHGKEVGANDLAQYIRKAEEFAKTAKKGSTKSYVDGAVEGTIRYKKNGKFIDIAPDGTIVSFGKS